MNKTLFLCNNFCMEKNKKTNLQSTKTKSSAQKGKKIEKADAQNVQKEAIKNSTTVASVTLNKPRQVSDTIFVNLIALFAIFLSALVPFLSFGLPVLFVIYFEVGVFGYVLQKEYGRQTKYENIFVPLKKYLKIFCTAVIKMFLVLFWSVLLIVPGIIYLLNYSFTPFILFESDSLDVKGTLMLSKELAKGHRLEIFFWALLSLALVCVMMSLVFLIILIFDTFLNVSSVIYLVLVLTAGFASLFVLALPMMEFVLADIYILAKNQKIERQNLPQ